MSRENNQFDDVTNPHDSQRPANRRPQSGSANADSAGINSRIPKVPGRHLRRTDGSSADTSATPKASAQRPRGTRPPFPSRQEHQANLRPQGNSPLTSGQVPPVRRPTGDAPASRRPETGGRPRPQQTGGAAPSRASAQGTRPAKRSQQSASPARGDRPTRPASLAAAYGRPASQPVRSDLTPPSGLPSRAQETKNKRQVKQRRRSKVQTGIILTIVAAILVGCFYLAINALTGGTSQVEAEDYPGPGTTEVIAVVNPGDTGTAIAKRLVELDVIKSEAAFIRAWEANQAANSVQPGSYTLKLQMSSADAVAALLDPTKRTSNAVSIASGFTIWQVAERLKANENFTDEEVDAAIANPTDIGLPPEAGGNLEGWLQPGSYEVHTDDKPADVLRAMVKARIAELDALKVPADQRQTVLIKASILEREVNGPTYMGKVARVIENRLSKPDAETVGLLQMDSTVLYGLKRSGGIPTTAETKQDTPYNTYLHKGLPPAPISMPSKAAIEATLNPEAGDWLYFVTVNLDTGETKFSSTNAEHEVYVKELKAWCAANKGKC